MRANQSQVRPSKAKSSGVEALAASLFEKEGLGVFDPDQCANCDGVVQLRERGIAAYRAWVPLERIRPVSIPQEKWEETFAWPANNEPPYPPLAPRILRGVISYVTVGLVAAVLLQVFTPFPVLTWLGELIKMLVG